MTSPTQWANQNRLPGRLSTLLFEIGMFTITSWHRLTSVFAAKNHCYHRRVIRWHLHHNHVFNHSPAQYFCSKLPGMPADIFQIHRFRKSPNARTLTAVDQVDSDA